MEIRIVPKSEADAMLPHRGKASKYQHIAQMVEALQDNQALVMPGAASQGQAIRYRLFQIFSGRHFRAAVWAACNGKDLVILKVKRGQQ